MSLEDFRQLFPKAYVGGQYKRTTAYELADIQYYVTQDDIDRQNYMVGSGSPKPRTKKEILWFYFYDNKLVKWGRPQDWPTPSQITVAKQSEPPAFEPKERTQVVTGTGFCVSPNGVIVTAYHVVQDASQIRVKFGDEGWLTAKLQKRSPINDIAVLKVDQPFSNYLSFAEPETVQQGQKVFTLGYPEVDVLGAEAKYTEGTINSMSGIVNEASWMQISVSLQRGNSGGPLLNMSGEVVGMTNWKADVKSYYNRTGTLPQNIGWAVKADYIMLLLPNESPNKLSTENKDFSQLLDHVKKSICFIEAVKASEVLGEKKKKSDTEGEESNRNKFRSTTRDYYKHRETGEVYVIETTWRNRVVSGYGPITGELRPLDTYVLTTEKNAELQRWRDENKLLWLEIDEEELKRQYEEKRKATQAKRIGTVTRDYFKHRDTDEVYIIDINKQRIIVGSYGPVSEDLLPLHKYELTTDKIAKMQAIINNKLIRLETEERRKLAGSINIDFWKHRDTGEIYLIEMSWRDIVFSGYGPIIGKPEALKTYKLTTDKNAELQQYRDNDKLVWLSGKDNQ